MMFTDPDDRQSEELMEELHASGRRSFQEQERLRRKWESRHPRTYQEPGEEKHDA